MIIKQNEQYSRKLIHENGFVTQFNIPLEKPVETAPKVPLLLCPHLGARTDPATARFYVTAENCCHHVRPATTVKGEQQRTYCLTRTHVNCPIYRHQAAIILPPKRLQRYRKGSYLFPTLFVCLLFIIAAVILSVTW